MRELGRPGGVAAVSIAEMRTLVAQELPGEQFRPLLSGRCAVIWIRPL
jgi:hypothetical protein